MTAHPNALVIVVPVWLILLAAAALLLGVIWRYRDVLDSWEAVSADVNFADLGKVTIRPNRDDIQIAHRAWVELATRKAGLPFDPNHDIVVEVYDSWYELFGRLRDLASQCPATKIRSDTNTRELVSTLTNVLNNGMRPHLTKWQGAFRRWYDHAISNADPSMSPQEVQRNYPQCDLLLTDLQAVQAGLQRYMDFLREYVSGQ